MYAKTGGGHRASAEALKSGFHLAFKDKYEAKPFKFDLPTSTLGSNCRCLDRTCTNRFKSNAKLL